MTFTPEELEDIIDALRTAIVYDESVLERFANDKHYDPTYTKARLERWKTMFHVMTE